MKFSPLFALVAMVMCVTGTMAATSSGANEGDEPLAVTVSASSEQYVVNSLAELSLSVLVERLVPRDVLNKSRARAGDADATALLDKALQQATIDANDQLARLAKDVVDRLRDASVLKLRTTSVSLEPMYESEPNQPARQIGVRAKEGLSFRTNITASGELLSSVVRSGATRIDGISFVGADDEIERVTLLAIRAATQKAKERGTEALREAGCDASAIVPRALTVSTPDGGQPQPFVRPLPFVALAKFAETTAAENALPVVGGENAIVVHVSITLQCARLL